MTFKEAKEQGYYVDDVRLERGYVSRRVNVDEQLVLEAGGRRKGETYVSAPCFESTRYKYRYYLTKK